MARTWFLINVCAKEEQKKGGTKKREIAHRRIGQLYLQDPN